jgi:hypothetical protein
VDRTRAAIRDHWRKRFEEKGIPFPEEGLDDTASRLQTAQKERRASKLQSFSEDESET